MSKRRIAIAIIVLLHIVGIAGLSSDFRALFIRLTPFSLVVSGLMLLYFEEDKSSSFWSIFVFILLMGYGLEVLGVNTGYPFGDYSYGEAFGWRWMGTPFLIGLNWWILAYAGAMICRTLTPILWLNALICGILITLIDFILEPVAISLNFWSWSGGNIPIQNYLTWFVCIMLFSWAIYRFSARSRNSLAPWVLGVKTMFFVLLLLLN